MTSALPMRCTCRGQAINMLNGFVKLHRKLLDWEYYKDINTKTLYIHLLLKAAFADYKTKDGYIIHAGTQFTSVKKLSDETGLTVREVRTSLKKLEDKSIVTSTATNKGTLITIVNWEVLQNTAETATNEMTSKTTNYNNKNITNKNINKNSRGGTVINFSKKKNSFMDYQQRTYDYEKIERLSRERLLKSAKEKEENQIKEL